MTTISSESRRGPRELVPETRLHLWSPQFLVDRHRDAWSASGRSIGHTCRSNGRGRRSVFVAGETGALRQLWSSSGNQGQRPRDMGDYQLLLEVKNTAFPQVRCE